MNVLVDTSVWSLALRRDSSPPSSFVTELAELIREFRVILIGPIRQEILSGIRQRAQFERLRRALRAFAEEAVQTEDYERAAEMFNTCRARGIQGSNTDFLICAVAERKQAAILTADKDFYAFSRVLKIRLHGPRA